MTIASQAPFGLLRWSAPTLPFVAVLGCVVAAPVRAQEAEPPAKAAPRPAPARDPRVGLKAGVTDAGVAIRNLTLVATRGKADGFFDPREVGNFEFANSDLAFRGNYAFQGGYHGFQVWDLSNPASPTVRMTFPCPGGQGDPSVFGNLLFMSVEETSGRVDCGGQGVTDTVSAERFRGVRIFDISDIDRPRQVAAVQTCRGSHTHTLVTDPRDAGNIYVYVSGTSIVRSPNELAGCSGQRPEVDPNTSLFQVEVIQVPLRDPARARIVNAARLFADRSGNVAGLAKEGAHGPGTQSTAETNMCHDITAYPAIGLAAGACSGNGILIDIRDPAAPKRIAEVSDPNFAYWHSATFNNDATTLVFTDEWGGGTSPRCRASDKPEWGANAVFSLADGKLTPASYFKLPAAQAGTENCVAHNGSLIPVPGRDIFVQAWYQGGISVIDFTDPAHLVEIAFFDRGPVTGDKLTLGGHWSAYWYNGHIVGSEIARGLDVLALKPSPLLSQNEIDAAASVRMEEFNPQLQPKLVWPASFVVARAFVDQLARNRRNRAGWVAAIGRDLRRAEQLSSDARRTALTGLSRRLQRDAEASADPVRVRKLAAVVNELAETR